MRAKRALSPSSSGSKDYGTHKVQYTFEVAKTEEIFDNLVKEKFITFPKDHQIPNKDELRGKTYCKYHNSWNHTTNSCWGFRNAI